jgi:hypothetical protein
MTFKEKEFNSDHFQCDSVQTQPDHKIDLIHNDYAKNPAG